MNKLKFTFMNRGLFSKRPIIFLTIIFLGLTKHSVAQTVRWTEKAVKPFTTGSGISRAMSFAIGNKIYVGGGYVGPFTNTKEFYEYDIATDKWAKKADLPGGFKNRSGGIGFAIGTKGYIGLGAEDNLSISGSKPLADLWEYDPTTDKWTAKASLPDSARTGAGCFVLNSKAYVVGGSIGSSDLWEYNPSSNTWTAKAPFPEGKIEEAYVFSLGTGTAARGYVSCGGTYTLGVGYQFYKKTYAYDAATDTWTAKADFPGSPRRSGNAFTMNGTAYCGFAVLDAAYSKYTDTFYSYNAVTNTWSSPIVNKFPKVARAHAYTVSLANSAYVGGGWSRSGSTQLFYNDFFKVDTLGASSVGEIKTKNEIKLYPNPAKEQLTIEIPSANITQAEVVFYDLSGRQVLKSVWNKNQALDISLLTKGIYTIEIQAYEKTYYDRVLISE